MLSDPQRAKHIQSIEAGRHQRDRRLAEACGHLSHAVRAMVPDASEAFIGYCLKQLLEVIYEAHTARTSGQLSD